MNLGKLMKNIPAAAVLAAGIAVIFTGAFLTALVGMDYPIHEGIVTGMDLSDPAAFFREHMEPLWHLMTYGVMHLLHCRVEIAAGLVSGFLFALLFVLAYVFLHKAVPQAPASAAAAASVLLHLSGAIYLPFFNPEPYLGQGSPNIWHNPTTITVKPLALLAFVLISSVLVRSRESNFEEKQPAWKYCLIALLLLLTNLAKPSFVQIYYPAIFVLMILWLFLYERKNLGLAVRLLIACIPSLALMIVQFILSFYSGSGEGAGIRFAPFEVARLYTKSVAGSLLLVLAFPIVIGVSDLLRKQVRWDDIFAWFLFGAGLLEKLLLAESGSRATHGNFNWGFVLGLYLVWFVSVRSWLARTCSENLPGSEGGKDGMDIGAILATVFLVLHFLCGFYYVFIYMAVMGHGL